MDDSTQFYKDFRTELGHYEADTFGIQLAATELGGGLAGKALQKIFGAVKALRAVEAAGEAAGTTDASAASVADKLQRYLLNPDHALGADKANWFQKALGFTRGNASDLAKQLVFDEKTAVQTGVTQYGTKFHQIIDVVGANGKTIPVRTAWIRGADGVPKLVTAVPGD